MEIKFIYWITCTVAPADFSIFSSAGGTAGAIVTCPLEVVKTRLQSSVATFDDVQPKRERSLQFVRLRGLQACLLGPSSTTVGSDVPSTKEFSPREKFRNLKLIRCLK